MNNNNARYTISRDRMADLRVNEWHCIVIPKKRHKTDAVVCYLGRIRQVQSLYFSSDLV